MSRLKPQKPPELIPIGRIIKPHGLKGEVGVIPYTENLENFDQEEVWITWRGFARKMRIEYFRRYSKGLLIKFEKTDSRERAEMLRDWEIAIEPSQLKELQEGEFYYRDLMNCQVKLEDGTDIGKVSDVVETGTTMLVVTSPEGSEHLIPLVEEFIVKIDIENKIIIVSLPSGLLEL